MMLNICNVPCENYILLCCSTWLAMVIPAIYASECFDDAHFWKDGYLKSNSVNGDVFFGF